MKLYYMIIIRQNWYFYNPTFNGCQSFLDFEKKNIINVGKMNIWGFIGRKKSIDKMVVLVKLTQLFVLKLKQTRFLMCCSSMFKLMIYSDDYESNVYFAGAYQICPSRPLLSQRKSFCLWWFWWKSLHLWWHDSRLGWWSRQPCSQRRSLWSELAILHSRTKLFYLNKIFC